MVDLESSTPQRRPLYLTFFMLSSNYIRSANILNAKVGELKRANVPGPQLVETQRDVAPAMIMCISFSIEVLLKCLQVIDRDDIRTKWDLAKAGINWGGREGHDYLYLFDKVAPLYQEFVCKHLAKYDASIQDVESVRSFLTRIGTRPFTVWRYVFELDSIPEYRQEDFKAFGDSLWQTARAIRKARRQE